MGSGERVKFPWVGQPLKPITILNMETTKILRFTPANFSYFPFHITFFEQLSAEQNSIKFLWLPF